MVFWTCPAYLKQKKVNGAAATEGTVAMEDGYDGTYCQSSPRLSMVVVFQGCSLSALSYLHDL
jgi:hypothetical protein